MKREPKERGQAHEKPSLIKTPIAEAEPVCKARCARRRRKERGKEKEKKRWCSQLRLKRPRTHQDNKRGVPSYDGNIQGHPNKNGGGKEGEEREREIERDREKEAEKEIEKEGRGRRNQEN